MMIHYLHRNTSEHSSVVEHHVANVMVVGSSPIARSIFFAQIPGFAAEIHFPQQLPFFCLNICTQKNGQIQIVPYLSVSVRTYPNRSILKDKAPANVFSDRKQAGSELSTPMDWKGTDGMDQHRTVHKYCRADPAEKQDGMLHERLFHQMTPQLCRRQNRLRQPLH